MGARAVREREGVGTWRAAIFFPPAPALLLMLLLAETAVRLAQQMRVGPCMPAGIEV